MSVINGNSSELIVKNGLVLNLDAGNRKSYISGSNTWYDLSGNNNNGTLTNGPTFSSNNGGSIVLDGSNDYITTPFSFSSRPFSINVWVYFNNLSGWQTFVGQDTSQYPHFASIYFQKSTSGGDPGFGRINNSVNLAILDVSNNIIVCDDRTPVTAGIWYNYCVSVNTTDITLFRNGVQVNTISNSSLISTPSGTAIIGAGYYDDGIVDYCNIRLPSIQIYNRALSASEVLQNYNANKSRFATSSLSISNIPKVPTNGLILSLDAANAKSYVSGSSVIYDLSGNNITGSVFGNPVYSSEGKGNIVFDGVNDYIQNNGYTPNANTISVWLKMNSTNDGLVIGVGNDAYASDQWNWSIFTNSVTLYLRGNPGAYGNANVNPVPTGEWINWTMIRDDGSGSCKVFKNGILYNVSGDSTLSNTYSGFRIGKGGNFANFSLGDTKIYNKVLSTQEIQNIYIAGKDRYGIRTAPSFIKKGIVLNLDASNTSSYISGSNTWYDLSGNSNNGTLTNGPVYDSAGSGSILFDGSNDYVNVPNNRSLSFMDNETTSEVTMEAWIYPTKSTGIQNIIIKYGNRTEYILRTLDGWSTVTVYFNMLSSGNDVFRSVAFPSRNAWHHVVGVYDGSKIYIYIDGALSNSWVQTGYIRTGTAPVQIGGINGYDQYYGGKIGEANVYNKALSAAEILAKYNATKGRYGL